MATYNITQIANSDDIFRIQDTVSGYTTNTGTITGLAVGNTTIASSGVANITLATLVNIFYPVGSYYETSLSTSEFDPRNGYWPGTWELESAGKVHVSAGTGYTIGSSGGSTSSSYTPVGTLADTSLTTSQVPAHTHGTAVFTSPNVDTYKFYVRRYSTSSSSTATLTQNVWASTSSSISQATGTGGRIQASSTDSLAGYRDLVTFNNTHTHGSVGSGATHTHTFTGTAESMSTLEPYIVVNRWHRTA